MVRVRQTFLYRGQEHCGDSFHFLFLRGKYLEVELPGHVLSVGLTSQETSQPYPSMPACFRFHQLGRQPRCSMSLSALAVLRLQA